MNFSDQSPLIFAVLKKDVRILDQDTSPFIVMKELYNYDQKHGHLIDLNKLLDDGHSYYTYPHISESYIHNIFFSFWKMEPIQTSQICLKIIHFKRQLKNILKTLLYL